MVALNDENASLFFERSKDTLLTALPCKDGHFEGAVECNEDTGQYVAEFQFPLYHGYRLVTREEVATLNGKPLLKDSRRG